MLLFMSILVQLLQSRQYLQVLKLKPPSQYQISLKKKPLVYFWSWISKSPVVIARPRQELPDGHLDVLCLCLARVLEQLLETDLSIKMISGWLSIFILSKHSPAPRCPHKVRGNQSTPSPSQVTNTPGVSDVSQGKVETICDVLSFVESFNGNHRSLNARMRMLICLKLLRKPTILNS